MCTATRPIANTAEPEVVSIVCRIARESDFEDLLTYSAPQELFSLRGKLESVVRAFKEARSPITDLCRTRLSQLRGHLAES